MRRILEHLGVAFHSQDQGDFTVGEIVIEVNGKQHETQTQRNHDAWKESELRKLGFRPLRFKEHEVLEHPALVAEIVRAYHLLACTGPHAVHQPEPTRQEFWALRDELAKFTEVRLKETRGPRPT
jgi:hypothetical protein